jgi:hypothetical protein
MTLSQQLSQVCLGTTYNFSMYVGVCTGGELSVDNVFTVTVGGTEIIPTQEPCSSADACPITLQPGYSIYYRFISAEVVLATESPILQIDANFNIPDGTQAADMLVDLVQLTVICSELTEGRNC